MTALAITASQVLAIADDTVVIWGTAGAAIAAGQVVYLDASTQTWKLFDGNDTAANTRTPRLAINSAASGQPVAVSAGGNITIGAAAAPTAGVVYCADIVAGGIIPAADLGSGNRVTIIGVGKASNQIALILWNSGVTP